MNILLLDPSEVDADGVARLDDRRAEHVAKVLGKSVGDTLSVGMLGGQLGTAQILEGTSLTLRCTFDTHPPHKCPITLVLALPRPPVLRRTLQHVTAMGVGQIVLLHTKRVEKSYWQSPALEPQAIEAQLRLGLEQAVDTVLPTVERARGFRPFVEDRLPSLCSGTSLLVAHPQASESCPCDVVDPVVLCVGPEGGFIPYEVEQLERAGARRVSLGPRILRVETAVTALLGRLGA